MAPSIDLAVAPVRRPCASPTAPAASQEADSAGIAATVQIAGSGLRHTGAGAGPQDLPEDGPPTAARFVADVLQNPHNRAILQRLPALGLPDAWLVAGCLFQTVWNLRSQRAPDAGIKDYDLFYFDASDLSAEAEQRVAARAAEQLGSLGVALEVKNQARVHTWYRAWFGFDYPALRDSREAIDRFLVPCTAVGLQMVAEDAPPRLYAPYGLQDLYGGILQPNRLCDHQALFRAKAQSYQARWPWLQLREPQGT